MCVEIKWLLDSLLLWLQKEAQVILSQFSCLIISLFVRILAAVIMTYSFDFIGVITEEQAQSVSKLQEAEVESLQELVSN